MPPNPSLPDRPPPHIDLDFSLASPMMRKRLLLLPPPPPPYRYPTSTTPKPTPTNTILIDPETTPTVGIFCGAAKGFAIALEKVRMYGDLAERKVLHEERRRLMKANWERVKDNAVMRKVLRDHSKEGDAMTNSTANSSIELSSLEDDSFSVMAEDHYASLSTYSSLEGGSVMTTTAMTEGVEGFKEMEVILPREEEQEEVMSAPSLEEEPAVQVETLLPLDEVISEEEAESGTQPRPVQMLSGPDHTPLSTFPSSEVKDCYGEYRMKREFVQDVMENMDVTLHHFFNTGKVVNVCSEPNASTFKVRGPTYSKTGVKIPSAPSFFSLIGIDNLVRSKGQSPSSTLHSSQYPYSFVNRLKRVCERNNIIPPFLVVINMNVPWGNLIAYMYRPNATNGPFRNDSNEPSEHLFRKFMEGNKHYRNQKLKILPRIQNGPWIVKKLVGSQPALIGQKLPVSYFGSLKQNYLEISLDIARGSALVNKVASTVAQKADGVTVDLGFVLEGGEGELPERLLGAFRLHHVDMKCKSWMEWKEEVERREMKQVC